MSYELKTNTRVLTREYRMYLLRKKIYEFLKFIAFAIIALTVLGIVGGMDADLIFPIGFTAY